jgi:hypothetical protein
MNSSEKIALILSVAQAIFASKMANSNITEIAVTTNTGTFPGRWFGDGKGGGTLRGFDFTVKDDNGVISLRILEQNPYKTDQFGNLKTNAILAQQGHQIAWVIRRDTNTFLGKVQDGKWEKNRPRATETMTYNAAVPGAGQFQPVPTQYQYTNYDMYNDDWQDELPDIDMNDIPEYVVGV